MHDRAILYPLSKQPLYL